MKTGNLYEGIPAELPKEIAETLMVSKEIKIERIVSKGHRSEPDFWYDQQDDEWVLLVKGEAVLRFEQGNRMVHLTEGMYISISAHERHRVESTTEGEETIWLAVFH
jgi:cupin 2 domain-containing protein